MLTDAEVEDCRPFLCFAQVCFKNGDPSNKTTNVRILKKAPGYTLMEKCGLL